MDLNEPIINNSHTFYLVDGQWSEWTAFGKCSKTCGGGTKERTRSCDSPKPQNGGRDCKGPAVQETECNTFKCPGVWSAWSSYGACSVSCDIGIHIRTRICLGKGECEGKSKETKVCTNKKCPSKNSILILWK